MTTTRLLSLLLAACAAQAYGGDAKVTLNSADGSSAFLVRDSASNEIARVQSDGKVGIGIAAPAFALDVLGDINFTGTLRTNGVPWISAANVTETDPLFAASAAAGVTADKVTAWDAAYGWGNHAAAGYLTAYTETDPAFAASAAATIHAEDMTAWNAKLGGSGTVGYVPRFTASGTVGDSALFSDALGNVGIGTNVPAYRLDVAGSLNASAITINGTPVASSTDTYWSTAGGGAIQYSGGNVGVGTATPAASAALDVTATDKGMLVPRLTQDQRDAVAAPATGLLIYQTDSTPGFYFFDGAQWSSISAGAGAVTTVSATAPLASSGGTAPTLSIQTASASQAGALSAADWKSFNGRVSTNLTVTTAAPLVGGGGLTNNLTLALPVASSTANGYLASTNWIAFNAKVPTNRIIATTGPLTGGGPLTNNLTLSMPAASASTNGYLSSADWTTFNNKVSGGANSTITSLTGLTTDLSVSQGGTGASTLTGVVHGNGTGAFTAGPVGLTSEVTGTLGISNGGSGSTTAAGARTNLGAAATGANSDITSLSGLTTALTVGQGGTGASTASAARANLGAAATGANSDITSLTGLTTDLSVAQGGTGASTLTANKVLVGNGASTPLQPTNLHWDNTNSRLGVGDTTPSYTVDVAGDVNVTGAFRVNGTAVNSATLDYAMARCDSGPSSSGVSVPWAGVYLRGEITTNATKTAFLLMAGKTYELECALAVMNNIALYYWAASDRSSPIGSPSISGTAQPPNYSAAASFQPKATTIFTPSTNTYVRIYISTMPAGAYIATGNNNCYAIIRELR